MLCIKILVSKKAGDLAALLILSLQSIWYGFMREYRKITIEFVYIKFAPLFLQNTFHHLFFFKWSQGEGKTFLILKSGTMQN